MTLDQQSFTASKGKLAPKASLKKLTYYLSIYSGENTNHLAHSLV